MRGIVFLRPALLGIAILMGVLLSDGFQTAEAVHTEYLVQNEVRNEGGTGSGGLNPTLWGVQRAWVINGQQLSVCSDWGSGYSDIPSGIRQAIDDWEAVLPGTQLNQDCNASSLKLWFKKRSLDPLSWPCGDFAWACAPATFSNDAIREANYVTNNEVWIDEAGLAYTDSGWRWIAGHELGHVFGLDEAYLGDEEEPPDPQCSSANSVMNALAPPSGNHIIGPCPLGSASPTQGDIDLVQSFYEGDPPGGPPENSPDDFNVTLWSPGIMGVGFLDWEWAESGYRFYAYRQSGSQWLYTGETWVRTHQVGNKDYWNSTTYFKDSSQPDGIYRVCVTVMTEIYGATGWACSPSVHMADHDPAAEWVITVGPAAVNLSDTNPRTMWSIAEFSNQGDHAERVDFSLSLYLPAPSGCSRTTQSLLPGLESRYLFPGESAFAVYRTFYECHAPAQPPGSDQSVTFTVSHPGGEEPLDARGNNNVAIIKFVIIQ